MTAQTSDRLSRVAAQRLRTTRDDIRAIVQGKGEGSVELLAQDIRALAASALRQDETRGKRGLVRRILGR